MSDRAAMHTAAHTSALQGCADGTGEQAVLTPEYLRAENQRLRQALQLRNRALDASTSGFLIVDMQRSGRPIVYANRALADRTGYTLDELIGKPSVILTPREPNPEAAPQIRDAMIAGRELRVELQTARKNGELYWTGISLAPVFNEQDKLTHYVSMSADITARRASQLQNQRDRERLIAVVESAMDGVIAVDGENRITLFNRAAETMFGRSAKSMLGEQLDVLMPERLRAAHRATGAPNLSVGLRATGEEFPIEASISRVILGGDTVLTVFLRDVSERQRADTERLHLETQLRLAQKLEAVGQLAAGIAHEINTPIQYVGDSVNFLETWRDDGGRVFNAYRTAIDEIEGGKPIAAVKEELRAIEEAGDMEFYRIEVPKAFERTLEGIERVANIVRAMKEFSHPDAADHEPADINHALETTLVVARNEYKYVATVETQFSELPFVVCNVGELNQVFLNLLVNAAHAIQETRQDPSTGRIVVSTAVDGPYVRITVSDNGCGIPQKNIDKVFDPFFTTKEVGKGTGQGLAITRSIVVVKHGGSVDVDTTVGAGTTFTLRLPIAGTGAQEVTQ